MKVDVVYRLKGVCIPKDHEYHLYSAVAKELEARFGLDLHKEEGIQIHPIRGRFYEGRLWLTKKSRFSIRCDRSFADRLSAMAGTIFSLPGVLPISIYDVRVFPLQASENLYCHRILFSSVMTATDVVASTESRLNRLGVKGWKRVRIPSKDGVERSRPFRIAKRGRLTSLVGFPLIIEGLSEEDSLMVQDKGLGGWKRKMGCGIFVPMMGGHHE